MLTDVYSVVRIDHEPCGAVLTMFFVVFAPCKVRGSALLIIADPLRTVSGRAFHDPARWREGTGDLVWIVTPLVPVFTIDTPSPGASIENHSPLFFENLCHERYECQNQAFRSIIMT
jgi:hypothetical protein